MADSDLVTEQVCACGHEHTSGRIGSCSRFTCPCNRWRPPEEEGDRNVSPRPESAQSEGVVEGVAADSPSSSGGLRTEPGASLMEARGLMFVDLGDRMVEVQQEGSSWNGLTDVYDRFALYAEDTFEAGVADYIEDEFGDAS